MEIVRALAAEQAEIAQLPIQEETRRLWRRLNGLVPERPMVMIDQVCWNEMNIDDQLTLVCEDAECRRHEDGLRRRLFQWRHFPVDMVVEPFIRVPMAVNNTGFGLGVKQDQVLRTEDDNAVVSQHFVNQLKTEEDLELLQPPVVAHDEAETERRLAVAHQLFDGIIEVKPWGLDPYVGIWDRICTWIGPNDLLYDFIDRPEFMHALAGRMRDCVLSLLDQLEEKGLHCGPQSLIHCTGAYTDELPAEGYDPERPRTRDCWMFGLAQMFSEVSPAMFKEYEIDYSRDICARYGMVYYGCCEPLDGKMNEVRMLPNVRKVSMSPWVNEERGAAEIGGDYVYSRKPNPAMLAATGFDGDAVRAHLAGTTDICRRNGCALELILKDISTVRHEPQRLIEWGRVAMELVTR